MGFEGLEIGGRRESFSHNEFLSQEVLEKTERTRKF